MKLGIIGGRTFMDSEMMEKTIISLYDIKNITVIVSGGAGGADTLGEMFAKKYNIITSVHKPLWDRYGKGASYIRNQKIVDESDEIIAFWDGISKGTKMTIGLANRSGKRVTVKRY